MFPCTNKHGMMRKLLLLLCLALGLTASAQDAKALYEAGKALYDAKNYAAAVPKLKAAAQKGYKKAQYRLGRCYDKGYGVDEDDNLAFQWYQKAAAQDHAKAQYQLGRCYKKGKGTQKDLKKAYSNFLQAARQENCDAQLALAECYLKGKGTKADRNKALTWARRAVNNEKGGQEIRQQLRDDAKAGDEDAIAILSLLKTKK